MNHVKKPGRRARNVVIALRVSAECKAKVERWAEAQRDNPKLAEALHRLVGIGLLHDAPPKRRSKKSKARASRMARLAIDRMADQSATARQRLARRQRLIQGPKEFRAARTD
jgi:hypothetical protein